MSKIQQLYNYLKFQLTARNAKGFGIHSPYIFHLVTEIINDFTPFYCYQSIELERSKLLKNQQTIKVIDLGSGSKVSANQHRKISKIARYSLKNKKQAQLLFRLVNYFDAQSILEIGTSFGITTSYLASVSSKSKVVTLEGCPETVAIAQNTFRNLNLANIEIFNGDFTDTLPQALASLNSLDFVFFDGNHSYQATLNYFNTCLPHIHNGTIFVFDDIHHSKEMEAAWNQIKANNSVQITLDLFHLGIVFFRSEFTKQDFNIKFW